MGGATCLFHCLDLIQDPVFRTVNIRHFFSFWKVIHHANFLFIVDETLFHFKMNILAVYSFLKEEANGWTVPSQRRSEFLSQESQPHKFPLTKD